MKRKLLQLIADKVINKLENSTNLDSFDFFYDFGIWLNEYCIIYYDIYLD